MSNAKNLIQKCVKKLTEEGDRGKALYDVISFIGEELSADRVYLFSTKSGDARGTAYEWCMPGVKRILDESAVVQKENSRYWNNFSLNNRIAFVEDFSKLKDARKEDIERLNSWGIHSFVFCRFISEENVIGYILVGNAKSDYDSALLETLFMIIQDALVEDDLRGKIDRISGELLMLRDNIPGGVCKIALDANFTLLYANDAFFEIIGYSKEKLQERDYSIASVLDAADVERISNVLQEALKSDERSFKMEVSIHRDNGELTKIEILGELMAAGNGIIGNCIVFDVTHRERRERELKLNQESVEAIIKHIPSDIFRYDIENGTLTKYGTENKLSFCETMSGLPEAFLHMKKFGEESRNKLYRMLLDIKAGSAEGTVEVEMRSKSGKIIWLCVSYHVITTDEGEPAYAIIAADDITSRKELEDAYLKEEKFRQVMMSRLALFCQINLSRDIIEHFYGKSFGSISEKSYTKTAEKVCELKIHKDDAEKFRSAFAREALLADFEMGIKKSEVEFRSALVDERFIWTHVSVHLAKDPGSGDIKAFVYATDIDREKREKLELREKAARDDLTGIFNKAHAREEIEAFIAANRNGAAGAMILVSLENLSKVHETYGHHFSDKVLVDTANYIAGSMRADDITGTLGGDKFVIFMKNISDASAAAEKAAQICVFAERHYTEELRVWCSIGISIYPNDGTSFAELLSKAESGNYEAMRQGKNRYAFYNRSQKAAYSTKQVLDEKREQTVENMRRKNMRRANTRNMIFSSRGIVAIYFIMAIASVLFFEHIVSGVKSGGMPQEALFSATVFAISLFAVPVLIMSIYVWFRRTKLRDDVTGKNNKTCFMKEARKLVRNDSRRNYIMVFCNVVMFTLINDQYGTKVGDEILRKIHAIIDESLGKGETSGRLRSDKFGILMISESDSVIERRLEEISDAAERLCDGDGLSYGIKLSYGIYKIVDTNMEISAMIDYASIAMDLISKTSKVAYGIYDNKYKQQILREKAMENRMRAALAHHDFQLFLQPKYRIADESLHSAEALVRWNDKDEGVIMPDSFIPLFERNGFIVQLDLYIFEEVCKTIQRWIRAGLRPVPVAVNLSRQNLDVPDFLDVYKKILREYDIPPRYIEFEFTETVVYDRADMLEKIVDDIHGMGCICAMDDFGSGYSSLNMLQRISVDVLKMDCAFFTETGYGNGKNRKLVSSIVSMAKALKLETVAEGVESREQFEFLKEQGCDYVQGYVFSPALSVSDFEQLKFGRNV
ncbi:MAG: EAL domain-containing protein [Clostridia bacterium]|nr:EAL domain-containing protein [Clostridia bacterium]